MSNGHHRRFHAHRKPLWSVCCGCRGLTANRGGLCTACLNEGLIPPREPRGVNKPLEYAQLRTAEAEARMLHRQPHVC